MIWSHSVSTGLIAIILLLGISVLPASGKVRVPSDYVTAAELHGIDDPVILYAIAMQESGRMDEETNLLKPWPWALNVEGKGYYFANMTEIWDALALFVQEEPRHIGIGLVQVTWPFNPDILTNPYLALEPSVNLALGARILRGCYDRHGDWWRAVGCYHSPTPKIATAYRQRVYRHWLALHRNGKKPS